MLLFCSGSNFVDFSQEIHEIEFGEANYSNSVSLKIVSAGNFLDFFPIFLENGFRSDAFNEGQVISESIELVTDFLCNFSCFGEVFVE